MFNFVKKVDISNILNFLNLTILGLTVFWFFRTDENPYVDGRVVATAVLVHAQLFFFLKREQKKPNPFLIILVIVVLFFYLLRIFTFLADEYMYSLTFKREGGENIGSSEIFRFLFYLHFCLWMIFFGLKYGDKRVENNFLNNKAISHRKYKNLIILSFTSLFYFLGSSFLIDGQTIAGLGVGLLSGFLNYEVFVMLTTIMSFYFKDSVPKRYSQTALIILILFFFFKILNGGSGPMLRIGFPFFFTLLMITRISIRLPLLLVTVILIGVTSIFGTFIKFSNQKISMELIRNFKTLEGEQYRFIFSQISARAAFLDFSVELINNKDYNKIINLPRYGKSILDAYTPGFDIFDEPLTGHTLRSVYTPSFPSKATRRYVAENYHSDQINVFSEYYILFGPVLSMPLLFLSAFFFKRVYNYFTNKVKNKIIGLLLGALILNIFWIWLRSFGLDFIIAEIPNNLFPVILVYLGMKVVLAHEGKSKEPVIEGSFS
jgi:hypothetical protein